MLDKIKEEFKLLTSDLMSGKLNKNTFFSRLAILDEKYLDHDYYYINIDGILCNIGTDLNDSIILKCAYKRLLKKLQKNDINKFRYDIGNTILSIVSLEDPDKSISTLLDNEKYAKARLYFDSVTHDNSDLKLRALTNSANILKRYGRHLEAITIYDECLLHNPNHAIALGNKALAIEYYTRLTPQQSLVLLNEAKVLLQASLHGTKLLKHGGKNAVEFFQSKLLYIEEQLSKTNYKPTRMKSKLFLTNYKKFILKNNLYLNFDFGYYYDKLSLEDNLFPNFVESFTKKKSNIAPHISEKIYISFHIFNQIFEDFTTCRYLYYNTLKKDYTSYEKGVKYVYLEDYSKNSIRYGIEKQIFATLNNCLDKLARILRYYFDLESTNINDENNIYFKDLQKPDFKDVVKKYDSYQLLALHNLSSDFKPKHPYYKLKAQRNKITHSFISVYKFSTEPENLTSFQVSEYTLSNSVIQMFHIVKAALIYFILFFRENDNTDSLTLPYEPLFQKDVY